MNSQNILKLIADLISFKTVYPNYNEFNNCINYIKKYFEKSDLYIDEFEFNHSKSLVISNVRTFNYDLIFCGHLDVVPASEELFNLNQKNAFLYGRGVSDMKGQVAVMMQVMNDLARKSLNKKIALFLTSDEERGGFDGVNKLLNDLNYNAKVAIVPDGGFNYTIVSEAKGVLQLKLTVFGVAAHASEPWNGSNSIVKLLSIIDKILTKYPNPNDSLDWKTSINISNISGGDSINKVPEKASVYLDIRYVFSDKTEDIINFIKELDDSLELEILAHGKSFKLNEDNDCVKDYINVASSLLNKNIDMINCQSASDGRFFTEKNIPCLVMNPVGGNIHCKDEWVSLKSLNILKKIYESYIEQL